jgi:hypothetical protein
LVTLFRPVGDTWNFMPMSIRRAAAHLWQLRYHSWNWRNMSGNPAIQIV